MPDERPSPIARLIPTIRIDVWRARRSAAVRREICQAYMLGRNDERRAREAQPSSAKG